MRHCKWVRLAAQRHLDDLQRAKDKSWGYHFDPGTNLIDVHIGRLRKKIDPPGQNPLIRTVRGSGYAIAEPV